MQNSLCAQLLRMFAPMLIASIVAFMFNSTPYLIEHLYDRPSEPLISCLKCIQGEYSVEPPESSLQHLYFLLSSAIALSVYLVFVICFSVGSICMRKILDKSSGIEVRRRKYFFASVILFVMLLLIPEFIKHSQCVSIFSPVFDRIDPMYAGHLYSTMDSLRIGLELMSAIAVVCIFSATATLVPTIAQKRKIKHIPAAIRQINHLNRWLNHYFWVAVVLLLLGISFEVAYTRYLMSYFGKDEHIESLLNGIAFFNSSFFVILLFLLVMPILFRFSAAASWIENSKAGSKTAIKRRKWKNKHGLEFFQITDSIKYILAALSPFMVPVLSLVIP